MTQLTTQDGQHAELLKQQALTVIQSLASDTWTDHNVGDPGITILEVLAIVITDLSNRLALPMADLLAYPPSEDSPKQAFFMPQQVLSSNAVTLSDYRRLFLNIEGVKGADISRQVLTRDGQETISGMYNVVIDFEDYLEQGSVELVAQAKQAILTQVRQQFLMQRNVNEDIASIVTVKKHPVAIAMSVSLKASVEPMTVIAQLLTSIKNTISPAINKFQYSQLQAQGLSGDEIFHGPLLSEGFVRDEDMETPSMPENLFSSDILSDLEGIEGLDTLKEFKFICEEDDCEELFWRMEIPPHHLANLNLADTYKALKLEIDGQSYDLPSLTKDELSQLIYTEIGQLGNGMPQELSHYVSGQYRQLSQYSSLQHQLPKLYALAEQRLNDSNISEEVAKILQFKGYLSLFDQVLADQFAQLETLKKLLALPNEKIFYRLADTFRQMLSSEVLTSKDLTQFWLDVKQLPFTQVSQPVQDISGMGRLLGDYFCQYAQQGFQEITEPDFSQVQLDRLMRSCEHLFSRFAETTLDASLLKYKDVFSHYLPAFQQAPNAQTPEANQPLINKLVKLKQIVDLVLLINDYPVLSRLRTGGFNYLGSDPKRQHSGGLVKRIMAFLGMSQANEIPLATNNKEGFYLLESELLRFGLVLDDNQAAAEYQALQLYFIAPLWPTRFANLEFKTLLERQIVKDSPVHQQANIVYLNREDMSLFERLYFAWLNAMSCLPLITGVLGETLPQPDEMSGESFKRVALLSGLLRKFLVATDSLPELILQTMTVEQLKLTMLLWLNEEQEKDQLKGDSIDALQTKFYEIMHNRYQQTANDNLSKDNLVAKQLSEQIIFTICQAQLDSLAKPNSIKAALSEPNAIKDAKIGTSFRVGFAPLNYLKPAYPMGNAVINPSADDESANHLGIQKILLDKPAFTLGIKQPLCI